MTNISKELGICVKCGQKYEPLFYPDGVHCPSKGERGIEMTDTALKQAIEMGEKQAKATHKAHDAAMARNTKEYFSRWLYSQPETDRKALVEAFNASYTTEASYYIGKR